MRALMLVAGAALSVSGCGDNQTAENTVNIDSTATADGISSNDTTAIDAATGDDANMAADVTYTINQDDNAANSGDSELSENKGEGNRD